MKTKTSMTKYAKTFGSVCLLFTLQQVELAQALENEQELHSDAQIGAKIDALSTQVQQALSQSGQGSEAYAKSEIHEMIESGLSHMIAETHEKTHGQKTNLEERSFAQLESAQKKHKKHHKHHHKELVQAKETKTPAAPAKAALAKTQADPFDAFGQTTDVPIDEVKAITLKVNPTYSQDVVESVTLKSFRKVVGYDTFNSILNGARDEKKDISDHYNVTLTVMVKRVPESTTTHTNDVFAGGKSLKQILDKGFPYDDGDNSIDDQTANWSKKNHAGQLQVGKLNGENVTKSALVNLIKDTDAPITQALVQLDEGKSDADGLFKLMDANVTRGNLKNLVTDKPAPITVAL